MIEWFNPCKDKKGENVLCREKITRELGQHTEKRQGNNARERERVE